MTDFIVNNLKKSVGEKQLFENIGFIVHPLDRIGLLGVNGVGKTSLLDVLSGKSGFDGDVSPFEVTSNYKINYLMQDPTFDEEATILESLLNDNGLPQARAIKNYELSLNELIKNPENTKLQEELSKFEAEITRLDAWNIEAEVKTILTKLDLPDFQSKIFALSGGQKRRVQLAQVLINPCDLLLLDEPTNHLDISAINWLQNYLLSKKFTLFFVTHDRYFLDAVATRVFELENAQLQEYQGNYQDYLEQKALREVQESASRHKAEQLYKSELTWIRKSPQARTTKQQARVQRFDDLKEQVKMGTKEENLQIKLSTQRLGKKVIEFAQAGFSFPDKAIFHDLDLIVKGNSRIGIVGDNGVGKSTLLNIINGELPLSEGSLAIGETVRIGYFSQEIRGIGKEDEDKRIISFLEDVASASRTRDGQTLSVVDLLEQFLFPRARHGEPISKLSGGEKKRLYLLKILLLRPNVLLLDEPTNDLDIATLTVLEKFLEDFPGAVLTVSHDRYFQDKVSDELLAFENGEIVHYYGFYSDYLKRASIEEAAVPLPERPAKSKSKDLKVRLTYTEKKEWESIEEEINELEERISEIDSEMNENGSDSVLLAELQKELDEVTQKLENKYERWEYLSEKMEES